MKTRTEITEEDIEELLKLIDGLVKSTFMGFSTKDWRILRQVITSDEFRNTVEKIGEIIWTKEDRENALKQLQDIQKKTSGRTMEGKGGIVHKIKGAADLLTTVAIGGAAHLLSRDKKKKE